MLVFQYDLEKQDILEIGQVFEHLKSNIPKEEFLCAIPNTCSLSKMDIDDLEAIRDMINKIIDNYYDYNKERIENGINK